jgi:hypothetical protein
MKLAMPESNAGSDSTQLTNVSTDEEQEWKLPSSSLSPLRIPNANGNVDDDVLDERVDGPQLTQDVSSNVAYVLFFNFLTVIVESNLIQVQVSKSTAYSSSVQSSSGHSSPVMSADYPVSS